MADPLGLKAVAVAETFLGQKEATGHNDGKFVNMVQDFVGKGLHGEPWCACFASYCIKLAATILGLGPSIPFMPRSASSSQIYSWAKHHGKLLVTPIAGCIGLVKGDPAHVGKTHHHTFLVRSVHEDLVSSIDGNSHDQVAHSSHTIHDCDWVEIC